MSKFYLNVKMLLSILVSVLAP